MSTNILNSYSSRDELYFHSEEKRKKRPLTVHVEDRPDVIFWRKIFAPYEESLDISYIPAHSQWSEQKQRTVSAGGKSMIMTLIQKGKIALSEDEIACVDADYDLIIADEYTSLIEQQPFIFTTLWYSIENIKCHPRNLRTMMCDLLYEANYGFNFSTWLEDKASSYARLLLLNLICRQCSQPEEYALEAMSNDIEKIEASEKSIEEVIEENNYFLAPMKEAVTALENELKAKGYEPKDYYKIMQGHMLVHKIVTPMLKRLLHDEYSEHKLDIGNISTDIEAFFKREYSVEYLDITKQIRDTLKTKLQL